MPSLTKDQLELLLFKSRAGDEVAARNFDAALHDVNTRESALALMKKHKSILKKFYYQSKPYIKNNEQCIDAVFKNLANLPTDCFDFDLGDSRTVLSFHSATPKSAFNSKTLTKELKQDPDSSRTSAHLSRLASTKEKLEWTTQFIHLKEECTGIKNIESSVDKISEVKVEETNNQGGGIVGNEPFYHKQFSRTIVVTLLLRDQPNKAAPKISHKKYGDVRVDSDSDSDDEDGGNGGGNGGNGGNNNGRRHPRGRRSLRYSSEMSVGF